jgi:hypothetical protein
MATIKSSTEHLTLNADGAGKEIKFQANGVEKAKVTATGIDVTGSVTCDDRVTIDGGTGYGNLEIGGDSGGYIDLKAPHSDDYDGRVQYDGAGDGALIITTRSSNSSPVVIKQQDSEKLRTTSTGIDVTGSVSTPEIYQNFSQGCISRKISTRVNQGNVWRKILRIDYASVASWGAAIVTIRTMSSYSTDVIQATYRLTSHAAAGSLTSSLQTGSTGNTAHIRFIKFATNQYDLELYSATSENAAADITFQTVSRNNQPIVTTILN